MAPMSATDPRHTHYRTLMLAETADGEIIATVYRKLAQRFHPDVDPSTEAAHRMTELNEAYAILRDPEKRAKYDRWLASRRDRRQSDRFVRQQGDVPHGTAGPPVGAPQGSLIDFGRYSGWTIGQIKRADVDYLEWLMHVPMGRRFKDEITALIGRKTA